MNTKHISFTASGGPQTMALTLATGALERMRGLLGQRALEPRQGLLISPCNMVHTFGMSYAIDVIYLGKGGVVTAVRQHLKPMRISCCLRARHVLELAAGEASRCGIGAGIVFPINSMLRT